MALGYSGASLGALITPLIVTPFALRFGWRSAFLITGGFGLLWLAGWAWVACLEPAWVRRSSGSLTNEGWLPA